MMQQTSWNGIAVRSLIALSLVVMSVSMAAPVAADTSTEASDPGVGVDLDPVADPVCKAYGEGNPTAGSEARCQFTFDALENAIEEKTP